MCEDALEHTREMMPFRTKLRHNEKELEAIDKVISSLQKKLTEMYQKKAKEYESILELKKEYDEEVLILCSILCFLLSPLSVNSSPFSFLRKIFVVIKPYTS